MSCCCPEMKQPSALPPLVPAHCQMNETAVHCDGRGRAGAVKAFVVGALGTVVLLTGLHVPSLVVMPLLEVAPELEPATVPELEPVLEPVLDPLDEPLVTAA